MKLLRKVGGKSILQHTFEAASRSKLSSDIIVAVDDETLAAEVESFGGRWLMTDRNCPSGTDRIAEVATSMPDVDVFINVQADEPEINPLIIDRVAKQLLDNPTAEMATAGTPIRELHVLNDPSCVKIVMAGSQLETASSSETPRIGEGQGRAVYFSRAAVPFVRDGITERILASDPPAFWHHIGLYAYRSDFLAWFASASPSPLEELEKLEQLRAIEAGKTIVVAGVDSATPGIDTQDDLDAFALRHESCPLPQLRKISAGSKR